MLIKLSPAQEAQLMVWARQNAGAEVAAGCEPAGYDLNITISSMGSQAEARWGSAALELGEVHVQLRAQPAAALKANRFLEMLKRFNAKERNFLMRYALCQTSSPTLSPMFVKDLVNRLSDIGIPMLEDVEAVYFGMDYHLEWIHAALLLAGEQLALENDGTSEHRFGGQTARIEDVDLLVVLQRPDASVVLALVEAKGVTSFGTEQLDSKVARLAELRTAMGEQNDWLTPVMLLMSPEVSRPTTNTLERFTTQLAPIGFWPETGEHRLAWMDLKGFFTDIGEPEYALRIGTCNADGTYAENLTARKANPYTHWRVEKRSFSAKKRGA